MTAVGMKPTPHLRMCQNSDKIIYMLPMAYIYVTKRGFVIFKTEKDKTTTKTTTTANKTTRKTYKKTEKKVKTKMKMKIGVCILDRATSVSCLLDTCEIHVTNLRIIDTSV